jgi:hypothetical protein
VSAVLLLALLAADPVDEALRAVELEAAKEQAAGRDVESLVDAVRKRSADCPRPRPCPECRCELPAAERVLVEVVLSGDKGVAQAWRGGDFPEILAERAFALPAAESAPVIESGWSTRSLVAWAVIGAATGALLVYVGSR